MALLRKIEQSTQGNSQAWEDTFRNWEANTRYLESYPKVKLGEEGRELTDMMKFSKRKTPHTNTEHELEVMTALNYFVNVCHYS